MRQNQGHDSTAIQKYHYFLWITLEFWYRIWSKTWNGFTLELFEYIFNNLKFYKMKISFGIEFGIWFKLVTVDKSDVHAN